MYLQGIQKVYACLNVAKVLINWDLSLLSGREIDVSNVIEVKNVCKNYTDFSLNNLSFSLPMGCIMGLVGQNGAGKTTMIRLILNMANRDGGEIRIFGLDNLNDEQKIKQDIGAVFDEIFFVDIWRVREVEKVIRGFYSKWDSKLYRQYLTKFRLPVDKKIKDLSRGMKMKLMLAVALSHEAKLLILDEPTSGLDPVARDELLEILKAYIADGQKSILFSTHITSDLEKIADYITLIDNGNLIYTGTKDDLLKRFSGLLPSSALLTIDEILVFISKGGRLHE